MINFLQKHKWARIAIIVILVVVIISGIVSVEKKIGKNLDGAFDQIVETADILPTLKTDAEKDSYIGTLQSWLVFHHTEIRDYTLYFPFKGYYIQDLGFFVQDVRSEEDIDEAVRIITEMAEYIEETGIRDITSKSYYMYLIDPMGAREKVAKILDKYDSTKLYHAGSK